MTSRQLVGVCCQIVKLSNTHTHYVKGTKSTNPLRIADGQVLVGPQSYHTHELQTNRRAAQRRVRLSIPRQLVIKQDKAYHTYTHTHSHAHTIASKQTSTTQGPNFNILYPHQLDSQTTQSMFNANRRLSVGTNTHTHTHTHTHTNTSLSNSHTHACTCARTHTP